MLALRGCILSTFGCADAATNPVEQGRLLTFVLLGAGPTGVEIGGPITGLRRETLRSVPEPRAVHPTSA